MYNYTNINCIHVADLWVGDVNFFKYLSAIAHLNDPIKVDFYKNKRSF